MCHCDDDDKDMTPIEQAYDELQKASYKISLLEKELSEWNQTFGTYGCEPQACLHTLLNQVEQACEQLVHPDPTLVPNADSWAAVWNTLRQCGIDDFAGHSISGRDRAVEYIRHLYKMAKAPSQDALDNAKCFQGVTQTAQAKALTDEKNKGWAIGRQYELCNIIKEAADRLQDVL